MIKSNKVYPTREKITIIEITINNHIFHSWYGSPAIIPADIFDAAITTGDTSGKNKIGTNTSLKFARIAIPETRLATDIIARLISKVVTTDNNKSEGYSINKNLKKGMITIASIIVRKMNPLIHLAKYINPLSIGELISKENASNSFSYEKER